MRLVWLLSGNECSVIFTLRSRYETSEFLTVLYAHAILREADTCGSGPKRE
jgi:hypothetical protein